MTQKMNQLEESMKQILEKVVEATYQSLVKSEFFVTKEDHMAMKLEVSSISKKLDILMDALHRNISDTPSPPRKNQCAGNDTQDSSALLIRDVAMREREA